MNCIILFSAPAAGKGTISEYIEKKYNIDHISASDIIKAGLINHPEYETQINNCLSNGTLISDDILFELLKERLIIQKKDYIMDGTPRTIDQAVRYEKLLNELGINLLKVIYINVEKQIAQDRIINRLICENCGSVYNKKNDKIVDNKCNVCNSVLSKRKDDDLQIYDTRYNIFLEKTKPLIDYYDKKGLLYVVNNNSDIAEAYNQVDSILKEMI